MCWCNYSFCIIACRGYVWVCVCWAYNLHAFNTDYEWKINRVKIFINILLLRQEEQQEPLKTLSLSVLIINKYKIMEWRQMHVNHTRILSSCVYVIRVSVCVCVCFEQTKMNRTTLLRHFFPIQINR